MFMFLLSSVLTIDLVGATPETGQCQSQDAVVRWYGDTVELETDAVFLKLDCSDKRLAWKAWVNKKTKSNLVPDHEPLVFDLLVSGSQGDFHFLTGWQMGIPKCQVLSHGEIQVSVPMEAQGIRVSRIFVLHPGLSLIRGWMEIENLGQEARKIGDLDILSLPFSLGSPRLKWMSGAECFGDSWRIREEPLTKTRAFDSFDPPSYGQSQALPGDGVDVQILLNDQAIWPDQGWGHSGHSSDTASHEISADVKPGDRIQFVLSRHQNMGWDTTEWDPVIEYSDGEKFQASQGFSSEQGSWRYEYLGDNGTRQDMVYDGATGTYGERWRKTIGVTEPFISAKDMHPDPAGHAVRVFVVSKPGRVAIKGSLRNIGNSGPAGPGFRMGTCTYAPWFCLTQPGSGESAYAGFDCMGHWGANIEPLEKSSYEEGAWLHIGIKGYSRTLGPGDIVRSPSSFFGLFNGDMDNMGQEILEWQYRTQWDYCREPWFPGVRMLGYWMKGTSWGTQGWVGGKPDMESAYRKVFRTADFMRSVGGDTYHRDWGWWDKAGDWNGPDFKTTGEYLRKYDMGQLIYAFIYTVDADSSVAKAHPDWLADGNTLDQSMPEVVEYEVKLLDDFYKRFGTFQWRNDSSPVAARKGDESVLLGQQQGFMTVLRRFLDDHPDCAFQGVNGGGMAINWEYLSYTSGFQFTDGQAQALANYHASYLFPPDRVNNMPDIWDPDKYDVALWRGLLVSNFDLTGDTFDPDKLEGLRLLIDIYHFLQAQGVVGRWVRVYHPVVEGEDETMVLQRLSWDRQRGILITKKLLNGPVTLKPKGLFPDQDYQVDFQESQERFSMKGKDLMDKGIQIEKPLPGELVYLNLPGHPGNRLDKTPPSSPKKVKAFLGRHMGMPGVDVSWQAAQDDTWLSHYEIFRDGKKIGISAKGLFFFDHSAGADSSLVYEVKAVDGSGNVSEPGKTRASRQPRRFVMKPDDQGVSLQGAWQKEDFLQAHQGSLSCAEDKGACLSLEVEGKDVRVHGRLGAQGGLFKITVDQEDPVTVSSYAADEIPEWTLFEKEWKETGKHSIKIEVLGEPDPRGSAKKVWIDAVSAGAP